MIVGCLVRRVPDCIPVTKILTDDPIRDTLDAQLRDGDHDLVMLGTRGRGALAASLRSGVSTYALRHGHVPVLIVRAEGEGEPEPRVRPSEASVAV